LQEYLLEIALKVTENIQCLFIQQNEDGSKIYLLKQRFNVELMGQAHWYLVTWINQLNNYDIELDQSQYCRLIVKKYLDTAGSKKVMSHLSTPFALDFVPTSEDAVMMKMPQKFWNKNTTSSIPHALDP
jgi:hypothetical protein